VASITRNEQPSASVRSALGAFGDNHHDIAWQESVGDRADPPDCDTPDCSG
jgi:hypothetical protein